MQTHFVIVRRADGTLDRHAHSGSLSRARYAAEHQDAPFVIVTEHGVRESTRGFTDAEMLAAVALARRALGLPAVRSRTAEQPPDAAEEGTALLARLQHYASRFGSAHPSRPHLHDAIDRMKAAIGSLTKE